MSFESGVFILPKNLELEEIRVFSVEGDVLLSQKRPVSILEEFFHNRAVSSVVFRGSLKMRFLGDFLKKVEQNKKQRDTF